MSESCFGDAGDGGVCDAVQHQVRRATDTHSQVLGAETYIWVSSIQLAGVGECYAGWGGDDGWAP